MRCTEGKSGMSINDGTGGHRFVEKREIVQSAMGAAANSLGTNSPHAWLAGLLSEIVNEQTQLGRIEV